MTIDYGSLIQQLGPVNNRFREAEGVEKIVALWLMGDIIFKGTGSGSLDKVFWEINKRSFITRDVLRYASIVRNEWGTEADITEKFASVKKFSLFREALPFLKGDRQGIDEETFTKVMQVISTDNLSDAKEYLSKLKEQYIGRTSKKGVSKTKVASDSQIINNFVKDLIIRVLENESLTGILRNELGDELLQKVSQTFYGLATERSVPQINVPSDSKEWHNFVEALVNISNGNREEKSAYRKLTGALNLMEWADFFNALRLESDYNEWKQRSKIAIKVR